MISGSEEKFDSFYCGMGDIDREELRSPRSESRRRSQSPRSRTRSRSHQRSTAEDQCNDTNPEIEAEQRKHEVSNPYPDGLSDIEIDIPSFPPKVQRPKPDRTPPKNPRTPKPGSGSGSVLQTLAGSYRGKDDYLTNRQIRELIEFFCDIKGCDPPTKDAVDTALSPNGLQRRGWIQRQKNTYCITQSGLEIADKIEQALKQEVTSEKDNSGKEKQMNKEETIGGCIAVDKNPSPPDDAEATGDAESEDLIPKGEIKEEVADYLEEASENGFENASDNALENASDDTMEKVLEDASQLVVVTMNTEPSPRVSKPPKFNGAPGYVLRALDSSFIEGKEYTFWEIHNTVSDFCKSISIHLESIPTPSAITAALKIKSAKNSTRTMQENGWILKNQDGYMITELGRKVAKKLHQEAAAYKRFRGNSAPAGQE